MALLMRWVIGKAHGLLPAVVIWLGLCAGAWAQSPTLVAQPGVTPPASIPELARALKYDVNLIYEYVYTNIEYSPTYGVKKGALGTLLDGSGNDMDQAALLVALLRQSGYTASYIYGQIRLGPSDVTAWLGVDVSVDACPLRNLLSNGGIPFAIAVIGTPNCTGTFFYADIRHTWISVTGGSLGATKYVFDPSFKSYVSASGVGLAAAIGYNQSTFLSSAESGATITPDSIQNVNQPNIASALTTYANNLVSYIRTNNPTATTRDILGGNYIKPLTQPYTPLTSLPYETPGDVPATWTGNIPDMYRTTLQIQIGGINETRFGDEIYGHRLSIVYNSSIQPVLYLDGVGLATGTANANTISYSVDFPFCFATAGPPSTGCGTAGGTNFTNIFTAQNVIKATPGYTYAIVAGWDFTGRGMVEFHRRQLQALTAAGGSATSEPMLGESLNVLGYSWLAQVDAATAINDQIIGTKTVALCALGVVAQVAGPYIDMPGLLVGVTSLTDDLNRGDTAFYSSTGAGSAFEWGTLDQNLSKAGVGAVSTIKLIDLANSLHNVFYDVTSANWGSVSPVVSGNYSSSDLARVNSYVSSGYRIILPDHGNLTQGIWTGAGYMITGTTPAGLEGIGYIISSNLKGGYSDYNIFAIDWQSLAEDTSLPVLPLVQVTGNDPIDLSSGAMLYDHDDISIGSAAFPYGLTFHRSYNSNNLYATGAQGPGWTHSLAINATMNSDGFKGMGQDSPIDGAAAIAAAYVIQDLFSDSAKPLDKVIVASLAQKWLMDRLINNTVNVAMGSQTEQFVLLSDGSYNPRLSSSNRLSLSGSNYAFQYKDGTTLNFDTNGNLSTWQNTSGVGVSFAYDTSTPPLLTTVTNSLGRSLSLAYNGSKQLTTVTDNSSPARSVAYTYDGGGNLASFSDPLGNITTNAYAPFGGSSLLAQIFYPSNPTTAFVTNTYDTLGRVATQANANGVVWNYFFAGYRSEEDDPYGTQHVLYYNPRGKVQFDIRDYGATPHLNLLTTVAYDGLDRTALTTLPEGGSTAYTYDNTINPWANNVASMMRIPKPGSPLTALTTAYTYEPTFNKPTSATDPLGLVTSMSYDPGTGNFVSVTADTGGAGHFNARTRFTYNGVGLVTSKTDPLGIVTQYAYDSFGNLTSTIADAGPSHLNQTASYAYDTTGNVVSFTDPNTRVTTGTYDAARRVTATTSPATTAAPGGIVTANNYDPDGRVLQVRQSAGGLVRTNSATYTLTGKQATATDANAHTTRYAYDLLDRRSSMTDAMNRVTQFTYDVLSRPYQTLDLAIQPSALLQRTWTADGLLAILTDANGNATGFAYDGFDRPSLTTYPLGSTEAYTYDANSNPLTRKTRAGDTISFTYDSLNRVSTKTPPSPAPVVTYGHDLNNRLTSTSDTSTAIASAVPPGGTSVSYATSTTYDALNRPTGVSWSPAPTTAAPATGSSVLFQHQYNSVNQRTSQAVSDNTWISYPAATPATTSYTANALNQYTAVAAVSPTYDGNGNTTSDGTYTLGYDAENRLTSASGVGNTASYTFDGRGRRKTKTVNGTTTISVTDADNREVLEYDGGTGAILRWYAYGLGANAVLGQMNVAAATRATFIPDMLGSVIGSMDASTGTLTSYAYKTYGSSTTAPAQFGYTGQRVDAESGTYYYRARQYSTGWGRFFQSDPIGYDAGTHLYAYVGNDPLNQTDSLGLAPEQSSMDAAASAGTTNAFLGPAATIAAGTAQAGAGAALTSLAVFGATFTVGMVSFPSSTSSQDTCANGGCDHPDPQILYHYTTEQGMLGIATSQQIYPSLAANNPNDVRHGEGQYFTDIAPGTRSDTQISRALIGNPFQASKFTNYVAIDVQGLPLLQGRPNVFVVPNTQPLNVGGRIYSYGRN